MAKQTQTFLTFAVTLPQPKGSSVVLTRKAIMQALADAGVEVTKVKVHLTNKEVKYG